RPRQQLLRQAAREAPFEDASVLVGIGRPVRARGGPPRREPNARFGRLRRDLAVRRIDDERGARRLHNFLAVVEPPHGMDRLLLDRSRIVRRPAVLAREREALVLDDLVRRHELAALKARRPLERRRAAEVPGPLEIGMAVGQARHAARLVGGEERRGESPGDSQAERRAKTLLVRHSERLWRTEKGSYPFFATKGD